MLSIAQFIPHVVRVFRVGTAGVSLATWALTSVATSAWFVWGLGQGAVATVVTNGVVAPMAWLVFIRIATQQRRATVPAVACMAALLCGAVGLAPGPVGFVLALVGPASNVPQLVRVFRAVDVSGVSVAGWVFAAVAQVMWVVWGVFGGFVAVWLGAAVSFVQVSIVAVVVKARRARASHVAHR